MQLGCLVTLLAAAAICANAPAGAAGALVVGSTSDLKDGIAVGSAINHGTAEEAQAAALKVCREYKPAPKAAAVCRLVETFSGQCFAFSFDPKPGASGVGWAIAASKTEAEQRAVDNCKAVAGARRRDFCKIEQSNCDTR
jgi:Domain of unknown function (DUF4189)